MEKLEIEKFIKKALPEQWFDYARELKEASDILWQSHSNILIGYKTYDEGNYTKKMYSRTYFLLLGIAIENLLKGILISEKPKYIENGMISNEISSGHNLIYLSSKVESIKFNDEEIEIYRILSEVIPYWGKYPIPKNFKKLKSEIFMTENWYHNLVNLYDKLELELYRLNLKKIKGPNGVDFPILKLGYLDEKL